MKKLSFLFIPLLSVLFSCGNSYVMAPEDLEDVLVDIHLAEGVLLQNSHDFNSKQLKVDLFNSVYEMHGVNKALFDSTLIYYSDDPIVLSDIYENVTARLEQIGNDVDEGWYALTKNIKDEVYYQQMLDEDAALLPNVSSEFWEGAKSYNFKEKKFLAYANTIANDSINGDVVLRFSMQSDSIASAQCQLAMIYQEDSVDMRFDLPVDNDGMVELKWQVKPGIESLKLVFRAEAMNDNSTCELSTFRIYNLDAEQRNTSIF